jgi:predicted ABC-type ATPase
VSEKPILLMVAGPNGSGKTTLTRQLRADGIVLGKYINPDDIAATLIGSYRERVAAAQRLAETQRQDCLSRRQSFSFETVMSHASKIEILKQAHLLGYFNVLYFVGTENPELNVARVRQRVALGGHDVPPDRIIARYNRTMDLLPDAIRNADRVVLFDNSYRFESSGMVRLTPFAEIVLKGGRHVGMRLGAEPRWATRAVQKARVVLKFSRTGRQLR